MFCPTCQLALGERKLLDTNLRGFACANGDVFYTTLNEQFGGIPTADTFRAPALDDDIAVLKFWLTDRRARERLPNDLALVCRRIVDIVEHDRHVAKVERPFVYCPTCGEALAHFESDDMYMAGLRCANGHELWWRGYSVDYFVDGARRNLSADLDDAYIPTLIKFYTSDDRLIAPYMHAQLRDVLQRWATREG